MATIATKLEKLKLSMRGQQRCGNVAGDAWFTLTGTSPRTLDDARCAKRELRMADVRLPPEGKVLVIGLSLDSLHQMVFAVSSDGTVHTIQSFMPIIPRVHAWQLTFSQLRTALSTLCAYTQKERRRWDEASAGALHVLTRCAHAQRVMDSTSAEDGFVVCDKRINGAIPVGKSFIKTTLGNKHVPKVYACMKTVDA